MKQRGSVRQRGKTFTAYWFVQDDSGLRHQMSQGGFNNNDAARRFLDTTLAITPSVSSEALPSVMTVEEVAELLRISPWSVYRLARTKKIPSLRLGRVYRFNRDVVLAMLGAS